MAASVTPFLASKATSLSFLARDGAEIFFFAPLIAGLIGLAFLTPHKGLRWFRHVEDAFGRLGRNRGRCIAAVGAAALLLITGIAAIAKLPVPKVDDEFSYLLAADTFAHGRLTNPTHVLWPHFETFHTIQQPTYASRYPPGQGLILSIGWLLGQPIIGVWLSAALAAAAICWLLLAWFPPRWALIGSLLAVAHPELVIWSQRYWGGSLALLGGALALGGFARILRNWRRGKVSLRPGDSTLMGIGVSILILSRPYEGGILILILIATLLAEFVRQRRTAMPRSVVRAGWPIAVAVIVTIAWFGYYNWRVTNDPFRMPQQVYVATYNVAPPFVWQKQLPTPIYHNKQMRDFHMGWELRHYLQQRHLAGLVTGVLERFWKILRGVFRLWPMLLGLLALPWTLKNGWMRLSLVIFAVFCVALLQVTWTYLHYAAPALPLVFAMIVVCLRHLRLWKWNDKPVGLFLGRGCIILSILSLPYTCWTIAEQNRYVRRNRIISQMKRYGGRHLVIVRYAPDAVNPVEWVYNRADIDNSDIVWARELDPADNQELLDYFKDRRVWMLHVGNRQTTLTPYNSPTCDREAQQKRFVMQFRQQDGRVSGVELIVAGPADEARSPIELQEKQVGPK